MTERPHIVILTPGYGGLVTMAYMDSVLALFQSCMASGVKISLRLLESSLITRARAELVARFMEVPDATHFLFIDADIGFAPEQAFRLLQFDGDVVGAAYPFKRIQWDKIERTVAAGRPNLESSSLHYVVHWKDSGTKTSKKGFAQVRYLGTGFMLVKRHVITRLCEAHPELRFTQTHGAGDKPLERFALFDTMIDHATGEYLSEDLAFCQRWTDLGGEIWLDLESKLDHVGPVTFRGNLATQFNKR